MSPRATNSRQIQFETLSSLEELWRSHQPYLRTHHLELRSRYRSGWVPSWTGTDKEPKDCDDGPPRNPVCFNMDSIDLTRPDSDAVVNLKYVSLFFYPEEVKIIEYLNNSELRNEPGNHTVHLIRDTLHPEEVAIIVTPLLRNYDDPGFGTIGEVVEFLRQIFEGLKFMHDHNVAYRCPEMDVMMDPTPLFPAMFHPNVPNKSMDLIGPARHTTRTSQPTTYFFTDFRNSRFYSKDEERKAGPILGLDQQAPEFQNENSLYDLFPTDVYWLGEKIRREILEKFAGFDFMQLLVFDMTTSDPNNRPTMKDVVIRFQDLLSRFSSSELQSRVVRLPSAVIACDDKSEPTYNQERRVLESYGEPESDEEPTYNQQPTYSQGRIALESYEEPESDEELAYNLERRMLESYEEEPMYKQEPTYDQVPPGLRLINVCLSPIIIVRLLWTIIVRPLWTIIVRPLWTIIVRLSLNIKKTVQTVGYRLRRLDPITEQIPRAQTDEIIDDISHLESTVPTAQGSPMQNPYFHNLGEVSLNSGQTDSERLISMSESSYELSMPEDDIQVPEICDPDPLAIDAEVEDDQADIIADGTESAEQRLQELQEVLDEGRSTMPEDRWIKLLRDLLRLCRQAKVLPPSYYLSGVVCHDRCPSDGGRYADVYMASCNGRQVALKVFRTFITKEDPVHTAFLREIAMWRQLDHPSIQPFLGVDRDSFAPRLAIVSNWELHGNINQAMRALDGRDEPVPHNQWILEIAEGLAYMHGRGFVHGDVRGANILIDNSDHVKLTDFGLTLLADAHTRTLGDHQGYAIRWAAPELMIGEVKRTTFSCDTYAFACTCVEIYSRQPPFKGLTNYQIMYTVLSDNVRPKRPLERTLAEGSRAMPDQLWKLVEQCWLRHADQRPVMSMVAAEMRVIASTS